MGKIQKLREQKKIEKEIKQERKNEQNKKIIGISIISILALVGIIYGVVWLINWKAGATNSLPQISSTATPSASTQASPLITQQNQTMQNNGKNPIVAIETEKGTIFLELFANDAPKTVANFLNLVNKGFYNGLTFHRVIAGFVIQGGDPKGDGTGGPGYAFEDEINPWSLGMDEQSIQQLQTQGYQYSKTLNSHLMTVGALAMANSGPNTNGSQFFIVTDQDQPHLNGKHTVFGQVAQGIDIVRKIQQGDIMKKVSVVQ